VTRRDGKRYGRGDKVTKAEQDRRLAWIENAYTRTMSTEATVRLARKPPEFDADGRLVGGGLGIGKRTTERYLKRLRDLWRSEATKERPHRVEQHRRAILRRISNAELAGRHSAVFAGHRLLAEIDGVRMPDEVKLLDEPDLDYDRYSTDELKMLRALLAKGRRRSTGNGDNGG